MKTGGTRRDLLKGTLTAAAGMAMWPAGMFSCTLPKPAAVSSLFEKTNIKSLEMSNRMMRSSTWSGVGDNRGYLTDLAFKVYKELAKGEISVILSGFQYVMPNGLYLENQIGNYDDDQIPGLKKIIRGCTSKRWKDGGPAGSLPGQIEYETLL